MIELRGSYRYASLDALDLALEAARAKLHDDDEHDAQLLGSFTRRGTTLAVHARMNDADPFAAAHVLETLAEHAIEGVVDVTDSRRGGHAFDSFGSGDEL